MKIRVFAAAMLFLFLSGCASGQVSSYARDRGWYDKTVEVFGLETTEQIDLYTPASDNPGVSVTDPIVTVQVLQTVSDGRSIYILVKASVAQDVPVPGDIFWGYGRMEIPDGDNGDLRLLGEAENDTHNMLSLYRYEAAQEIPSGTEVTLVLQDVNYAPGQGKMNVAIPGVWRLTWTLRYTEINSIFPAEP